MAVGASDDYWDDARLPGVLKHKILERYLAVFLTRTSSKSGRAAYIDAFAGRGKYADGKLGSAGHMLNFAAGQLHRRGKIIDLYFSERNSESFKMLDALCETYRRRGVSVHSERKHAADFLPDALREASGLPAFLFLDPCGVGIPHADLVAAANRNDGSGWPPTEFMINFSLEALRRIGGLVRSESPNLATLARLDSALGGDWWHSYFTDGVTDENVHEVTTSYSQKLSAETGMSIIGVPVRRKAHHKPIYCLMYGTRHSAGLWNFSNATALSQQDWWNAVTDQENTNGNLSLFDPTPQLAEVERSAIPTIAENIYGLTSRHGRIRLGDFPAEVFGEYIGQVREGAARAAVKRLHKEGRTPSTGVGGKVEALVVEPPN